MYEKEANTLVVSENSSTCMFHDTNMIPRTKSEYEWALENDYVIPAFRNGEYNVEKFLDYVDVKLDWYIPSEDAFNVINFIRMAMGKEPENLNSKAHYFFIDAMLGSDSIEPYYKVRNVPYYTMNDSALILSSREFSKALHWETKIATPTGPVEIQDIEDGDMVISRTGKPTRVIKKSEMILDNTFKMELEDGRNFKSSNDHKHILWRKKRKYVGYFKDGVRCSKADGGKAWVISGMEEVEMTSQELYIVGATRPRRVTNSHRRGYENVYYIPRMDSGIQYEPVHSPIDPYTVGVILGDGSVALGKKLSMSDEKIKARRSVSQNDSLHNRKYEENQVWNNSRGRTRITVHKGDMDSLLDNIPYECKVSEHTNRSGTTKTVILPSELNKTIADFIGVERSYTKRVPKVLLTGSVSQRLAVLQGLMDTDGTINKKGSPSYTTVSKGLAEDVVDLVQTLGGSARISERKTGSKFGIAYQVMISINTYSIFRLQRKKDRETCIPARDCFPIKSFEMVHSEPAYCLTVECPTQSFVMADGLLTHNSVLLMFLILYMAYTGKKPNFGKVNFVLYVSDRMEGNVKSTMRTIKGLVKKSEFLSSSFEHTEFTDSKVKLIRHPSTTKEIRAYKKAVSAGKKLDEVPYRGERTFTLQGIGSSGGRGPLALDEVLYTDNGKVTMKDVAVGDFVATPTGGFSRVKKKSEVFNNDMYELVYDDGRTLKVNQTHINPVWTRDNCYKTFKKENIVTSDLFERFNNRISGKYGKEQLATMIPESVEYTEKKFALDPYLIGIALGDGYMEYGKGLRIKGIDFHAEHYYDKLKDKYNITKSVSYEDTGTRMIKLSVHGINNELKLLGLSGLTGSDKYIPSEYFYGSIEQRRELLAGLLDTDGSCSIDKRSKSSATTFSNISKHLADGVVELARGLGYRASVNHKDRGGNRKRLYTVKISGAVNPFTLKYKKDKFIPLKRNVGAIKLVDIRRIPNEPSQCITLDDENHEFLTTGYLTTHNSRDEDLARPDGVFFDDLIANEKDAFSKATLDAIESTIEADVGKSLSGNKHFKVFVGTAYHENDPIYRRAGNGAAIPVVFPRAEKAPHGDVYDSDGKWVRGPMTEEEFISVWEDRHSFENQRREYAKAELALKNGDPLPIRKTDQEYYVRVVSATDQLIGDQYIQFGNVKHVLQNAADYLWRITTDYTTTNALSSDDSGCVLWAISWDRKFYMIDMSLRKKSIEEQYDDTIAMGRKALSYGATFVETAVEIDGQQAAHLYGLQKRADEVGYDIFFAKQYDPQTGKPANWNGIKSKGSGDKLWRMKMFAPEFYRKAVIFNEQLEHTAEMSTGLTQIKMTTHSEIKAPHDDFIDCEVAGTKVLVNNGTTVNIEDLKKSDSVLTYHHAGGLTSSRIVSDVIRKESVVSDYTTSSGDTISCTDNHMVMTEDGYKFACELVPGDKILRIKKWKHMDANEHAQEKDAVTSYTSVLQSEVKSNVQKNVNLNIDVQVEEKVKSKINDFEPVEIIAIGNRRTEVVYGFEVDGTNNYFSGSGLMMHNCVSQNFLCSEMYLPLKPIEKKQEKGYNSVQSVHDALLAIDNDDSYDVGDYGEVY